MKGSIYNFEIALLIDMNEIDGFTLVFYFYNGDGNRCVSQMDMAMLLYSEFFILYYFDLFLLLCELMELFI